MENNKKNVNKSKEVKNAATTSKLTSWGVFSKAFNRSFDEWLMVSGRFLGDLLGLAFAAAVIAVPGLVIHQFENTLPHQILVCVNLLEMIADWGVIAMFLAVQVKSVYIFIMNIVENQGG